MTDAPCITYDALLEDEGAIPVPFDQRALFGRARPPVVVEIGGHRYRSTVAIMSGVTFVPLRRSHREAAGVVAGGTYPVTLTLDTAPREIEAPADLAAAIDAAGLGAAWTRLSYSHRREHVEAIAAAKKPETRARRIAAALAKLAGP